MMLNQSNESQAERIEQLLKKIEDQPEILGQLERILQIVENETGEAMTADEAEELLVWEMRRLGQIAMGSWARRKESRLEAEYNGQSRMVKREKKR
jgi:hypothetical protein